MHVDLKASTYIKIIIIVLANILLIGVLNTAVELEARKQARLNLEHIKTCVTNYEHDKGKSIYDLNLSEIQSALNICASDSLVGGRTGDVWAINLQNMNIVWDNSVDCKPKDNKTPLKLTRNGICKLFHDPESCLQVARDIRKGYNGSYTWYFNAEPEWGEYIILPSQERTFDGKFRTQTLRPFQVVIGQGVQKPEIMLYYKYVIWVSILISLIIIIVILVYDIKREALCGRCKHAKFKQ